MVGLFFPFVLQHQQSFLAALPIRCDQKTVLKSRCWWEVLFGTSARRVDPLLKSAAGGRNKAECSPDAHFYISKHNTL